jgi:hypothetical protein
MELNYGLSISLTVEVRGYAALSYPTEKGAVVKKKVCWKRDKI